MRLILIISVLVFSGGAVACSPRARPAPGTLSVVASFYPLAEAALRVGGDLVTVTNLTPSGVEPHDLELSPDQVEAITTADLVVYLGEGFQPALEDAVAQTDATVSDVLDGVGTLAPPPGEEGPVVDPHVWLDPGRFATIVGEVRDSLTGIDPGHRSAYDAGASAYAEELAELDAQFRTGLADCARSTMVTNHVAFGYLADAYGLTQYGISGVDPEAEPDPRRIADLRDLVRDLGITTIFTEDLVSAEVAETLAQEAGVRTDVLHTLEGIPDDEVAAGADYVSQMLENLDILRGALDCA